MKQEYIDLVENTWGEDEEFAEALFSMLGRDEKLFKKVLKEDLSFNRYTCDVSTWEDLLETIIQDPCFEDKEYNVKINYWKDNNEIRSIAHSNDIPVTVREIIESNEAFDESPEEAVKVIETYFTENGGTCEIKYENLNAIKKIIESIKIEIDILKR